MTAGQIMLRAFAVVGLIIPILFITSGASANFCEQVISVLTFPISSLIHVNMGQILHTVRIKSHTKVSLAGAFIPA